MLQYCTVNVHILCIGLAKESNCWMTSRYTATKDEPGSQIPNMGYCGVIKYQYNCTLKLLHEHYENIYLLRIQIYLQNSDFFHLWAAVTFHKEINPSGIVWSSLHCFIHSLQTSNEHVVTFITLLQRSNSKILSAWWYYSLTRPQLNFNCCVECWYHPQFNSQDIASKHRAVYSLPSLIPLRWTSVPTRTVVICTFQIQSFSFPILFKSLVNV